MKKFTPREGAPFTVEEVASGLGILRASARVLCHRRVAAGDFLRLKRNFYLRARDLSALDEGALFSISNLVLAQAMPPRQ